MRGNWTRREQTLRINVTSYDMDIFAAEDTNKKMDFDYLDTATDLK